MCFLRMTANAYAYGKIRDLVKTDVHMKYEGNKKGKDLENKIIRDWLKSKNIPSYIWQMYS